MEAQIEELQRQVAQLLQERGDAPPAAAPPQGLQHVVNLKPERPPTYSGKRNESLAAWIFQMERYCQLLPVPANNRVEFAGTFLKDHAAIWWQSAYVTIEQWDEFKEGLLSQFQPVNSSKNARARLDALRQRTSVRIYNTEFRELVILIPRMHEEDQIHHYIKGLKPNIASLVAMQQPDTLLMAQGLADTADTIQFQTRP
jgi:Ty3 transposon capsid-like protein